MTHSHGRTARRLGALALAALLALAAPQSHAQSKLTKVRIGTTQTAAVAPAWLAEIYGTYKEQGVEVELINFRGAVELISAGVGGSLELMATGVEQPALLAERGAEPWRDIVALLGSSAFSIVVQPSSKIKAGDFAATKGMRWGIPGLGRPSHSIVKVLLKEAGLDPENDVNYVDQPSGPEGIIAWERQRSDIAIVNEPVTSSLISRGSARMFVDLREGRHGAISQVPQATLLAPLRLIKNERAVMDRVVRAVCLAAKRGRQNPDEAARLLAVRWGAEKGADVEILRSGIIKAAPAWTPQLPEGPVNAWFKVLVEAKALKQVPRYGDVVDTSFSKLWEC